MKKHIMIILAILMLTSMLVSCAAEQTSVEVEQNASEQINEISEDDEDINLEMYDTGNFNLNLLKAISNVDKSKNVFYSEYSLNSALTMVMLGASGKTKEEMLKTLGYAGGDDCKISFGFEESISRYNAMTDSKVNVANSIWIDDEEKINEGYLEKAKLSFEAEANSIDLQSSDAVPTINGWISDKTNGMIENILQEPFDPLARLVLVNAIYFKGEWTMPFNPDSNTNLDFNGTDKTTKDAEMMVSTDGFYGYEYNDCKVLQMHYGDSREMSMVMMLPNEDIDEFIGNMDYEKYSQLLSTFERQENTYICIPKFEVEERLEMNAVLQQLGIREAFVTETDFQNMGSGDLRLGEVIHQAKVRVDEAGTEAAAATVAIMLGKGMPAETETFEFVVDKPFIFFIVDNEEMKPLFTGVIKNLD